MALALSFDDADAVRIENYAAQRQMSVFEFVRQAVMEAINREDDRIARREEYLTELDRDIEEAEAEYQRDGVLLDAEESLSALRRKHFG